jgi:hypothetical protein
MLIYCDICTKSTSIFYFCENVSKSTRYSWFDGARVLCVCVSVYNAEQKVDVFLSLVCDLFWYCDHVIVVLVL